MTNAAQKIHDLFSISVSAISVAEIEMLCKKYGAGFALFSAETCRRKSPATTFAQWRMSINHWYRVWADETFAPTRPRQTNEMTGDYTP